MRVQFYSKIITHVHVTLRSNQVQRAGQEPFRPRESWIHSQERLWDWNKTRISNSVAAPCLPLVFNTYSQPGVKAEVSVTSAMSDTLQNQSVAHQAPLFLGVSRKEYWCGLPFPSPADLPDPGIKPRSPASQAESLPSEPPGKPHVTWCIHTLQASSYFSGSYPETQRPVPASEGHMPWMSGVFLKAPPPALRHRHTSTSHSGNFLQGRGRLWAVHLL